MKQAGQNKNRIQFKIDGGNHSYFKGFCKTYYNIKNNGLYRLLGNFDANNFRNNFIKRMVTDENN